MLYVARTFLADCKRQHDKTACIMTKVRGFYTLCKNEAFAFEVAFYNAVASEYPILSASFHIGRPGLLPLAASP